MRLIWRLPGKSYPAITRKCVTHDFSRTILTILSQSDFQLTRKRCLPRRPDLPGAAANQSSLGKCFPGGSARNTCSAIPGFAYSPDYPDSLLRWQFPTRPSAKPQTQLEDFPYLALPHPTRHFPGASPEKCLTRHPRRACSFEVPQKN